MKTFKLLALLSLTVLLVFNCASPRASYDLPSVEAPAQPEWVKAPVDVRDTIFVVINLPVQGKTDLTHTIQEAQSELHALLMNEVELVLRDYWNQHEPSKSDDEIFMRLSQMPLTLEQIMSHIVIKDAWERSGQMAVLCSFDHIEVSELIMIDMQIKDRSFLHYFKQQMDILALSHQ